MVLRIFRRIFVSDPHRILDLFSNSCFTKNCTHYDCRVQFKFTYEKYVFLRWENQTVTIGSQEAEFTILLVVTPSRKQPHHVAIDNITLVNCFQGKIKHENLFQISLLHSLFIGYSVAPVFHHLLSGILIFTFDTSPSLAYYHPRKPQTFPNLSLLYINYASFRKDDKTL